MHRFEGVLKFLIILSNILFYIKWSGHLAASAHTVLMPLACKDIAMSWGQFNILMLITQVVYGSLFSDLVAKG